MREADQALEVLALDRPTATMLIRDDSDDRHFIAEGLLIGAGLFLLEVYGEGFLRGVGFKKLAEEHGRKARELFQKICSSKDKATADVDLLKEHTEKTLDEVRKHDSAEGQSQGENAVKSALVEAGVPSGLASKIANRTSLASRAES